MDKQALKALVDKREILELEMNTIIARLTGPNQPGLQGGLVDKEGFPRADIDVHAVRSDRNRLAVLKTDHTAISAHLEREISRAFSTPRDAAEPRPPRQPLNPADPKRQRLDGSDVEMATGAALGVVDEIAPQSPAEAAGFALGDIVLALGSVSITAGETDGMRRVAAAVSENENNVVEVVVLRQGEHITLSLTPRRWEGRGLLGCHLRPLC